MQRLISKRSVFGFFLIGLSFAALGQNAQKQKLEKRKSQLQAEIDAANGILKETQKNKELTLNQVQALDQKIRVREALITTVRSQIQESEKEIVRQKAEIDSLNGYIQDLKEKYAGMIRSAQKRGSTNRALALIFASKDLQQAMKRLYYLGQYSEFRHNQIDEIKAVQAELSQLITAREAEQGRKRQLLGQEVSQKQKLSEEKALQMEAIAKLKTKESQITTDIRQKSSELAKLQKQIRKIIDDELKRQQEAARKKAKEEQEKSGSSASSESITYSLTPAGAALAKDFASNRGKLPWPVERGFITQSFGENKVPGTTGVTINNPGVDIGTPSKSVVRSVFQGEVSTVVRIPGGNRVVLIRHGNYFTVYSNLDEVYVKTGDQVLTKQEIGRVAADAETGESTLHFELWMNTENKDPKPWLGN